MAAEYAPLHNHRSPASSSAAEEDDFAKTTDLLESPTWQPKTWFRDFAFATKEYAYGSLFGRPSHVPDLSMLKRRVLEAVAESEEMSAMSTAHETSPASDILYRMMAKPTMLAIRFLGWVLGKVWRAAFTSVLIHNMPLLQETYHRKDKRVALILVPTHRSHADYLLMSYICYGLDLGVPLIAAGDNLNVSILGSLLARAGAFFIKRQSGSPRYRAVLQAYLSEIAKSGVPIEFFVEGGRSRRGHIGKPKLGLLGIIVDLVRDGEIPDALLVPCSLDYDCVPESASFTTEVLGTAKKKPESLFGTIKAGVGMGFFHPPELTRAKKEWLLYGQRGGSVYVGFADNAISVKDCLARIQRLQAGRALHEQAFETPNRPLSIFRGGSNTSLAAQDQDEFAVAEIGRLVVAAQRDAALITAGGILACVFLSVPRGEAVEGDLLSKKALTVVDLLLDLGYANRIPQNTLTSTTIRDDMQRAIVSLGGAAVRSWDVKSRLKLRYSCAPVVVRLLPVCVSAFDPNGHVLFRWLSEMFDINTLDSKVAESFPPCPSELSRDFRILMAPLIFVLASTLDEISTFRVDAVVKEDFVVSRVQDALSSNPYPESSAALEIIGALRACTSIGVLIRSQIHEEHHKKVTAYQVNQSQLEMLTTGRLALDMARLAL